MTTQNHFYVYVHRRLSTGTPFYIGKGHGCRANSRKSRNRHWRHVVDKEGGFLAEFLKAGIDEELAILGEIEAIDAYRRRGVSLVNMTAGGDGTSGLKLTAEHIQKLVDSHKNKPVWNKGVSQPEALRKLQSQRLRGNTYRRGKKSSDEVRRKQSIAQTGRKHSAETRAKISASNMGKVISAEAREKTRQAHIGRKASEQTKRKMSETRKGRPAINKGITPSDDARAKMRAAQLARWARIKAERVSS